MAGSYPHEEKLYRQLQGLIQAVEAAGKAVLPSTNQELLQSIVEAAARIFGAAAASIALTDEVQQELVFRVACGAGQEDLIGMRIPIDQGIAGYVVMTGQPIAVSNVQHDPRFNQTFAKSTGYVPRSILATPLISGERIIGVMEVLDKINAPSFGLQDMELLGIFAAQAALAIHQSQQYDRIGAALIQALKKLAGEGSPELQTVLDEAAGKPGLEASPEELDLLRLTELIYEFSTLGEAERRLCIQVLNAFFDYRAARVGIY